MTRGTCAVREAERLGGWQCLKRVVKSHTIDAPDPWVPALEDVEIDLVGSGGPSQLKARGYIGRLGIGPIALDQRDQPVPHPAVPSFSQIDTTTRSNAIS